MNYTGYYNKLAKRFNKIGLGTQHNLTKIKISVSPLQKESVSPV